MPFLLALTILGWAHLIGVYRSLINRRPPLLHMLALFGFMLAFMDAAYLSPLNSRGVPGDARNWVPTAILVFGLLSILAFGWKFYTMYRGGGDQSRSGWRSGLSLSLAICAHPLEKVKVSSYTF